MERKILLLSIMALFCAVFLESACFAVPVVKKWDVFDIRLEADAEYDNPYEESLPEEGNALARITFTGINGEALGKKTTVTAFWDGKNYWRARFAPSAAGDWSFVSISSDPGMNGIHGMIRCEDWTDVEKTANSTRRGYIHVSKNGPRPDRHFEYADGTPFFWMADIWSYWTRKGILFSTFQELVKDRVEKGFTVGMMRFPGNGRGNPLDSTYNHIDIAHMREIDNMVKYANSEGLTVWLLHWWGGNYIASIEKEKVRRWCRYLIHRLGAYNVIWVAAGEYNLYNYGGLGIEYWKELSRMIKEEDPYGHVTGIHHTPPGWRGGVDAPQWSTAELLQNEAYLDYNQSQVGHNKWRNEMIPHVIREAYAAFPPKPILCTEPWIEFLKHKTPAADIRFGAWSAVLSGAAGHTYGGGGVWIADVPEKPVTPFSYDKEWFHTTLDYPGAQGISHMMRFLNTIEWWKLEPHPELIEEYSHAYCSAELGEEYVLYLRWGGSLLLNLKDSLSGVVFSYEWYNPRTGENAGNGTVEGGTLQRFSAPQEYPGTPGYRDWVLHVKRR